MPQYYKHHFFSSLSTDFVQGGIYIYFTADILITMRKLDDAVNSFHRFIKEEANKQRVDLSELILSIYPSKSTFYRNRINSPGDFRASELVKLAEKLNIKPEKLFSELVACITKKEDKL